MAEKAAPVNSSWTPPCSSLGVIAPPGGEHPQLLAREVPPCPERADAELSLLQTGLFTVCPGTSWGQQRATSLLLTFISFSFQGSLYETSNLERGGGNRKKKIEEFSRSSREKLVQSKNKMFSKFTSILQHAVEAVSCGQYYLFYAIVCLFLCKINGLIGLLLI